MLKAKDIMTTNLITVLPDMAITHATKFLLEKSINGVPVVDEVGKLVGILCQSDLIAQQKKIPIPSLFTVFGGFIPLTSIKHIEKEVRKIAAITVAHAMTTNPVTVEPEASVEDVAGLMTDKNFHTIPVVDEERLVGIVGMEDILKTVVS